MSSQGKYRITLFLVFIFNHLVSQDLYHDPKFLKLQRTTSDSEFVRHTNSITFKYYKHFPDTCLKLLNKSLAILERKKLSHLKNIGDPVQKQHDQVTRYYAAYLLRKGEITDLIGKKLEALELYKKSLREFQAAERYDHAAHAYAHMANLLAVLGQTKEALILVDSALHLSIKHNLPLVQASALNNLGILQSNAGMIREARESYLKCLEIGEKNKEMRLIANSKMNIGNTYNREGEHLKAKAMYEESLIEFARIKDIDGQLNCLESIYHLELEDNNFSKAEELIDQSMKMAREFKRNESVSECLFAVGNIHLKKGQYKKAIPVLEKSYELLKTDGKLKPKSRVNELLYQAYAKTGEYRKALKTLEELMIIKDSVLNQGTRNAILKNKYINEYNLKVNADSVKQAGERELTNARLREQEANLDNAKTHRYALVGGLALTVVFTGLLFGRFRKSQRQRSIIEKQKVQVDTARKKLLDSIHYAKHIQNSMLRSAEEIEHQFADMYIYFKPKDIVSGDFYWFYHHDGISYAAAIDCTGHGVPGAFMTMIAHAAITEVVLSKKRTDPGRILSELHSHIHLLLQQHKSGNNAQDGMDMSLAVIDHKKNNIRFAGARNHAYLVSGGQISILKADPCSIGGLNILGKTENHREFSSSSFPFLSGDSLILFTDGIIDQLNNSDEKFGTTRFREMILKLTSARDLTEVDQLIGEMEAWKGAQEQLDDMLFIALKS